MCMDSQWLKTQFQIHPHKTKAQLARFLGLEPPAVSKILAATRQIKAQEYIKMREFFGLGGDLSHGSRKSDAYILEPLKSGMSEQESYDGEWSIPASILNQRTKAQPDQVKIFLIEENVMEPNLKKGEHVIVDLSDKKPSPPGIFVISDGFGFMARHCAFKPVSSPPEVKISAIQKNFEPQTLPREDIDILGRVIAKMQWI